MLPADYVADEVTLAYAVTVHKAQGVTVDRAVVVADRATTAEALYVGMTRGRQDNHALVVCGRPDDEHRQERLDGVEVRAGALQRVSAEQAALEVLRPELAASESLATLAFRLADLDAWIAREVPPDPSVELERLASRRSYLERTARPGILRRAGRDDRRALAALDARREELESAAEHRSAWLERHAETLAYCQELAAQVSARRSALGLTAAAAQPAHLVELLGPVPDDPGQRAAWTALAGRVEAYREQWGVATEELCEPPSDGIQYREWETTVQTAELFGRHSRGVEPDVELGCGVDL